MISLRPACSFYIKKNRVFSSNRSSSRMKKNKYCWRIVPTCRGSVQCSLCAILTDHLYAPCSSHRKYSVVRFYAYELVNWMNTWAATQTECESDPNREISIILNTRLWPRDVQLYRTVTSIHRFSSSISLRMHVFRNSWFAIRACHFSWSHCLLLLIVDFASNRLVVWMMTWRLSE